MENRAETEIIVLWGSASKESFIYSEGIAVQPNKAIARRIQCELSTFSSTHPCVRVNYDYEKTSTITLCEPNSTVHTKKFIVTADGIEEIREPTDHRWHSGEIAIYQAEPR